MQETYIPVLGEGIVFDLSCAGTKRSFENANEGNIEQKLSTV
jgi:hypothetical protein